MVIKEIQIKNSETGELVTVEVCVCKFCGSDFEKYECDVFPAMNIIRTEHINVCKSCHLKKIPVISGIKSTGDFYTEDGKQLKPEYQPDQKKLDMIKAQLLVKNKK